MVSPCSGLYDFHSPVGIGVCRQASSSREPSMTGGLEIFTGRNSAGGVCPEAPAGVMTVAAPSRASTPAVRHGMNMMR
jgi:hypothetical protein